MVHPNGNRIEYNASDQKVGGLPMWHSHHEARETAFGLKDSADQLGEDIDQIPFGLRDDQVGRAHELNALANEILAALPQHLRVRTKE